MSSNRPNLKIANSYSRTRTKSKYSCRKETPITNYFTPAKSAVNNACNNTSPKKLTNGLHSETRNDASIQFTDTLDLSSHIKENLKLENGIDGGEHSISSVCTRSKSQKLMANLVLCDSCPKQEFAATPLHADGKSPSVDNERTPHLSPHFTNGIKTPPLSGAEETSGDGTVPSSPHTGPPTPHKIQALNEAKLRLDSPLSPSCKTITPRKLKFSKPISNAKRKLPNQSSISFLSNANAGCKPGAGCEQKGAKPPLNGALKSNSARLVAMKNTQITQFFPIRRSHRKSKTTLIQEKQKWIEEKILSGNEEGLKAECFQSKGRGVKTTRHFRKGEMVVEYVGDLIDMKEAKEREKTYSLDTSKGCYMYYFTYQNTQYCIDATEESGYLGRLVNHSRNGNLATKTVEVSGKPHLILLAKRDLDVGTEILYDYGDRSKQSLEHHPWLAL